MKNSRASYKIPPLLDTAQMATGLQTSMTRVDGLEPNRRTDDFLFGSRDTKIFQERILPLTIS